MTKITKIFISIITTGNRSWVYMSNVIPKIEVISVEYYIIIVLIKNESSFVSFLFDNQILVHHGFILHEQTADILKYLKSGVSFIVTFQQFTLYNRLLEQTQRSTASYPPC
jgi:hypothetical protein